MGQSWPSNVCVFIFFQHSLLEIIVLETLSDILKMDTFLIKNSNLSLSICERLVSSTNTNFYWYMCFIVDYILRDDNSRQKEGFLSCFQMG